MNDFLEIVGGLLAFTFIVSPIIGFVWFMRYIKRKERQVLKQYGLLPEEKRS